MPTTGNGVTYTVHDTTLAAGTPGRVLIPAGRETEPDVPVLLFCHGNNQNYLSFSQGSPYAKFRDVALGEHRMVVVEATAGVSATDNGGNNYGNNYGRTVYEQALAYADSLIAHPGKVIVMGGSAGGMVSAWLAAQASFLATRIAGYICHRGVVNAYVWRAGNEMGLGSTPPSTYNPQWHKAQPGVFMTAYGLADSTQATYDASVIPSRDPLLFPDADWSRVPKVLFLSGSIDSTVPPYWHGTKLHTDRLAGLLGANATNHITTGSDHGAASPSTYDESVFLSQWITSALGTPVTPPSATARTSRTAEHLVLLL